MKIIRCHVENFGKLSDTTLNFDRRIQVFREDNGWGKSTLAAFVKAMFYGFAGEGRKNDIDNERRRYRPWQGGVYGGSLVFEANGKNYEIVRRFGTKAKDDSFAIYDATTNMPTGDFTVNVGEELFGIDMESFARSAFIGQLDCKTSATGSIHAKIGNLTDNTDDINNYEAVHKRLADLINSMSPGRATGSIRKISDEINDLKVEAARSEAIDETIEQLKEKIAETTKVRDDLIEHQKEIRSEITKISESKVLKAKKDNYERLCDEYHSLKAVYDSKAAVFKGYVPDSEEVAAQIENARQHNTYVGVVDNARLSDNEVTELRELRHFFGDTVPTKEAVADIKSYAAYYDNLQTEKAKEQFTESDKARVMQLNEKFKNGAPSAETVADMRNRWSESREKKKNLLIRRGVMEKFKMLIEREKKEYEDEVVRIQKKFRIMLVIGIALAAIGAILTTMNIAGIAVVAAGIIAVGAAVFMNKKDRQRLGKGVDTSSQEKQLSDVQKEVKEDEEFIREMDKRMAEFCNRYGYELNSKILDELYLLQNEIPEYENLLAKKASYEAKNYEEKIGSSYAYLNEQLGKYFTEEQMQQLGFYNCTLDLDSKIDRKAPLDKKYNEYIALRKKVADYEDKIVSFLSKCDIVPQEDLEGQIRDIAENLKELERLKVQLDGAKLRKDTFEKDVDVSQFTPELDEYAAKDPEDLKEELDNSIAEINRAGENVIAYRKQVDTAVDKKEGCMQLEADLADKLEQRDKLLHKYHVIENTSELLEKAKENFTAQFMAPIVESFSKYYHKLTGIDADKFRVDADINVTAKEYGEFKSTEQLSAGYQDLIGLCMRMALVDAMYQEEKPFVILDDPFVNLDDDKVKGGLEFLQELSRNYQVIYFTCHESRIF